MRENLASFLADVALDPERTVQLSTNPTALLNNADLSPAERAAVLTRSSRRIAQALGDDGFALGDVSNIKPAKKAPPKKKRPTKKGPAKKAPSKKTPARKRATKKPGSRKR